MELNTMCEIAFQLKAKFIHVAEIVEIKDTIKIIIHGEKNLLKEYSTISRLSKMAEATHWEYLGQKGFRFSSSSRKKGGNMKISLAFLINYVSLAKLGYS